ncbi:hypothetical protein AVEN_171577-1, partial [Araneus ventricosus]
GRCSLLVRTRPRSRRAQGPIPLKVCHVCGPSVKSDVDQTSSRWCGVVLGDGGASSGAVLVI